MRAERFVEGTEDCKQPGRQEGAWLQQPRRFGALPDWVEQGIAQACPDQIRMHDFPWSHP